MARKVKKYPGIFPLCTNRRALIQCGAIIPHPDLAEQIQLNKETRYTDEEISVGPSFANPWSRMPMLRLY